MPKIEATKIHLYQLGTNFFRAKDKDKNQMLSRLGRRTDFELSPVLSPSYTQRKREQGEGGGGEGRES